MPLSLLAGPANAGKVALLLERYLDALDSDPILIVPNRPDVDRAERELLTRAGALVGGSIGTFDDLFERIAQGNGSHRPVIGQAQRTLLLRRVVPGAEGRSARFSGFADSLGTTVAELESALLEPDELDGELAAPLRRLPRGARPARALDRELERAPCRRAGRGRPRRVGAAGRCSRTGSGPDRRPWALLEALAARAEVTVSRPYEPGRDAFASLSRTAEDLSRLAEGRIEELPPSREARSAVLAHLERSLFSAGATRASG